MHYRTIEPLSNDEIVTLITGEWTEAVRERIIQNYVPLALATAKRFPHKYIDPDEAEGLALFHTVRCVNNAPGFSHPEKFTGYLRTCVYRAIYHHCNKWRFQSVVKHATVRAMLPLTGDNEPVSCRDPECSIDFDDFLDYHFEGRDLFIINHIMLGYKQHEIAKNCNCSPAYISQRWTVISDKMIDLLA